MRKLQLGLAESSAIATLCLVISLVVATVDAASPGRAGPKAIVPFTSFTFGDVHTGEVISQLFVIKNEGDEELRILDFKGDCGCTAVRSDSVIPPGREATAEVEVQTVSQSGLINKTAVLHTNDPGKPVIVFTLVANVLAGPPTRPGKRIGPIFLSPGSQAAMFASPGKKAMAELAITADDVPVNVLRVEAGTKNFAPRVEVVEPGRSYKIIIESQQLGTGGLYADRLRIATDNPALPAFTVDLSLRVYDNQ